MKTEIQNKDGIITAVLDGELDTAATVQTQESLKPLFEAKDAKIIVDCENLKYISSSGLRLFLGLLKQSKANGSTLTLSHMNPEVRNVFKLTGFDKLFEIV